MSRKLVDLDHTFKSLQDDGSTSEMRLKSRRALEPTSQNRLPKVSLVGAVAGTLAFLMWPRATAGNVWAQAIDSSTKAVIVHYVCKDPEGHVTTDEWTYGEKVARMIYRSTGEVFLEWRSDGQKTFSYFDGNAPWRTTNPNTERYAMVSTRKSDALGHTFNFDGRFEKLMEFQRAKIVSQKDITTSQGPAIQYELADQYPKAPHYYAIVNKNTGYIVRTEGKEKKWVATYDYPNSVDESLFEPKPQVVKGLHVYDIQEISNDVNRRLDHGLGTSKGVTLRLVAKDSMGAVWALWTGSAVNSKTMQQTPFTIDGVKLGISFGPAKFVQKPGKDENPFELTKDGQRIYGMGRIGLGKVGDFVNISIPAPNGAKAVFKHVPVISLGSPSYYFPWASHHKESKVTLHRLPKAGQ